MAAGERQKAIAGSIRAGLVAGILALLSAWGPGSAFAASCGGGVPCKCGDTVTANYTLMQDLGPCRGHGLVVKSGVSLDCRDSRITGLGDGSEQFGIFLNGRPGSEVMGTTIRNCRVSGFLRGIRLRSASNNVIAGNIATGNGNMRTHEGYGIDVSGASPNNLLEGNRTEGNADEGIHIGYGSHKNRLVGNTSSDNYRENLYLLGANGGVFLRNTLGGGGVNSLYLKDSSFNRFEDNTFVGKTARVIGDSHDNQFVNNTFSGAGLHFTEYKAKPARSPAKNHVRGGRIAGAAECVRFTSSSGNVIADVAFSDCKTAVRAESPAGPSENTLLGEPPVTMRLDEGSTVNLGVPVTVHVRETTGAPVQGAQVQAKDASGATAFTAVTDDTGSIPVQIVIAETRTATRPTTRGPFTLTVEKPGYAMETRTIPATEPANLSISLEPRP